MPYGTLAADTLQSSTGNTAPVFRDGNSVEIGRLCKSLICYNGGSPPTALGSFNVSSLTYSAAGTYSIAFATSFSGTTYSMGSISPSPGSATTAMNTLNVYAGSITVRSGYWYSTNWYTTDGGPQSLVVFT